MEIYQYPPLSSPKATRLFKLSAFGKQIQGTLIEVDLDNPPRYDAISYVWGSSTLDQSILCDGKVIKVTSSCEAVLRRVRNFLFPKLVWIDVICIDQSSIPERSQQVGIMHEIYSRARNALIWLGEGTEYSDRAISLLEYFVLVPMLPKTMGQEISDLQLGRGADTSFLVKDKDAVREAFDDLFGRAWFWRTWTIQEVALAPNAKVLCGQKSISWELMGMAMAFWEQSHERSAHMLAPKQYMSIMRTHWSASRDIKIFKGERTVVKKTVYWGKPTLKNLLEMSKGRKATDPRDKVFALDGMARFYGLETVQPNYDESFSAAKVFTLTTMIALLDEKEDPLSLLYLVGPSTMADLPSWVPDWSRTDRLAVLHHDDFQAAGDSSPCSSMSGDGQVFRCAGVSVDRIGSFSTLRFDEDPQDIIPTLQEWTELTSRLASYPNGESVDVAFCKTLIQDKYEAEIHLDNRLNETIASLGLGDAPFLGDQKLLQPSIDYYRAFKAWHPVIMETADPPVECIACKRHAALEARRSADGDDQPKFDGLPTAPREDLEAYARTVVTTSRNMCFFLTESGYFGTTYHDVLSPEDDDIIVVLAGLKVPFIVRPKAQEHLSYELIGAAYVHGMMRGERWPETTYTDSEEEWDVDDKDFSAQDQGSAAKSTIHRTKKPYQHRHRLRNARRQDRGTSSRGGHRTAKRNGQSLQDAGENPLKNKSEEELELGVSDDAQVPDDTSDDWETTDSDSDSDDSMSSGHEFFWLGDELRKDFERSDPDEGSMGEDERWAFESFMMGKRRMFRFV